MKKNGTASQVHQMKHIASSIHQQKATHSQKQKTRHKKQPFPINQHQKKQ
jgi:hypothetical protein